MNKTEIAIGKTVTVADTEFIILDVTEKGVVCLTKDFVYKRAKFDEDSNNYASSELRNKLNTKFFKKLADAVGKENIVDVELDLTSDDGLDDYGKVTDKVGLLTADMYRKYNRIIEKFPVNDWWWLATPWSTPHRGYSFSVRCVYDFGTLHYDLCYGINGVRPFCIFSPTIFES